MNQLVYCEICDKLFLFDGQYRMGALVCEPCNNKNKEFLQEYWEGSITGQLKSKRVKDLNTPEEGKVYALTGATNTPSIANGNSWKESEVKI